LLRFNVLAFAILTIALIAGIVSSVYFASLPGWAHTVSFSLIILVVFSVAAYFLNLNRLYVYGAMLGLSPIVGEWLWARFDVPHHGYPVTFGSTAAVTILVGLIKFVRLLRSYPLPAEQPHLEGPHGE
jgi:hypothetical protein